MSKRAQNQKINEIISKVGPSRIWRPVLDMDGNRLVKGKGDAKDDLPENLTDAFWQGKTVVDLGCNLGSNAFTAARRGALRVLGIDHEKDIIEACNGLKKIYRLYNVSFLCADFTKMKPPRKFDTALMIDIIGKNIIREGLTDRFLEAAAAFASHELLLTLRPSYPLQKSFGPSACRLETCFPKHYLRDGLLHLLEYAEDYLKKAWTMSIFNDEPARKGDYKYFIRFARRAA